MTISLEDKFSLLFDVGKTICAAYTGFSACEIQYCQNKSNWNNLQSFLMSDDPYEALIQLELNPVLDVVGYYQLLVGCMLQFPNEDKNKRLENLLNIIDNESNLDDAMKNTKILKALLAISSKYSSSHKTVLFSLFLNCKRILAHVLKKFPDIFKMNLLRSRTKARRLRFTKEEIDKFW